jgi:hypothetical protein
MTGLCFSVVLWGRPFVDLFTRWVLPSHLAPRNLPALALRGRAEYLVVTTAEDREAIMATPAFRALEAQLPVVWALGTFGGTDIRSDAKYAWMTEAHRHVLAHARARDLGAWFLTPDTLLADGALARIERAVLAGHRASVVTGLMVDQTRFLPLLDDWIAREGAGDAFARGALGVPPRALMAMATRSYHRIVDAYRWDSMRFNQFPSFVYWSLGDAGLLARCFHLHPIFVHPEDWDAPIHGDTFRTIDQTYVARAVPDPAKIDVPTDSDEFLLLELAPPEKRYPTYDRSFAAPRRIGAWAARETEVLNWAFFRQQLWFHTGIDRARFADVVRASDRFVDETLRHAVAARQALAA